MAVRFFALDCRSSVSRWLIISAFGLLAAWSATHLLGGVHGVLAVPIFVIAALIVGKLFVESVRRLHDCGQGAVIASAGMLGIASLFGTAALRWLGYGADSIAWAVLVLAIVATGVLFLRPGDVNNNAYGPPPRGFASPRPSVSEGKAGAFVASGFGLAGLAAGLGILAWQSALERQRDARMERLARDPLPASVDVGTRSEDNPLDNENAATSDRIDALLNEGDSR